MWELVVSYMLHEIIQGDCLELLPELQERYGKRLVVISDPPYGGDYDTDYTRFSGSIKENNIFQKIHGDNQEFNPTPFLGFEKVTLFGYQHFATKVPLGTILVWQKKNDYELGTFLSDAELAWQKGGMGVYCYKQRWSGFMREGEEKSNKTLHPTQKPIGLMRWCIERQKINRDTDIVLDPFAGSGTTLVAAVQLGFNCIGIELEPDYVAVAEERIAKEIKQPRLFAV